MVTIDGRADYDDADVRCSIGPNCKVSWLTEDERRISRARRHGPMCHAHLVFTRSDLQQAVANCGAPRPLLCKALDFPYATLAKKHLAEGTATLNRVRYRVQPPGNGVRFTVECPCCLRWVGVAKLKQHAVVHQEPCPNCGGPKGYPSGHAVGCPEST